MPPVLAAVQDRLETQLAPQRERNQRRSPAGRLLRRDLLRLNLPSCRSVAPKDPHQRVEVRCELVLAPQGGDDALLGAAALPVGLDQANVFVHDPGTTTRPDRTQKHILTSDDIAPVPYWSRKQRAKPESRLSLGISADPLPSPATTRSCGSTHHAKCQTWANLPSRAREPSHSIAPRIPVGFFTTRRSLLAYSPSTLDTS